MPLEPGGSGGGARLVGDGQGAAALAYHVPAATPEGPRLVGRLALLDVARGAVGRTHTVCADPDVVVDAALEPGPPGPVAYLAVWRPAARIDGRWRPAAGRILAVDALTGAGLGAAALPGPPAQLRLARAPGDAGRVLYCLVGGLGPEGDPGAETDLVASGPWRLLGLDPITLLPEREHALPAPGAGAGHRPGLPTRPTPSTRRGGGRSSGSTCAQGRRAGWRRCRAPGRPSRSRGSGSTSPTGAGRCGPSTRGAAPWSGRSPSAAGRSGWR